MPRIRANQNTSHYHFTPAENVKQEPFGDSVKLVDPQIIVLLGKEAGTLFKGDTIPANKTVKLLFGAVRSSYVLCLTLPHNDKYIAGSYVIFSKSDMELSLTVQTIKAVPVSELSTALLVALRD